MYQPVSSEIGTFDGVLHVDDGLDLVLSTFEDAAKLGQELVGSDNCFGTGFLKNSFLLFDF